MAGSLALPFALIFVISAGSFAQVPAPPLEPATCGPDDERIEVLLLGSYHMANPGADLFNVEADDVLAPERQREIEDVVGRLAAFRPTRVAIEAVWGDTVAPARYRAYRAGDHELSRSEEEQIAFRLAALMELPDVDPIDEDGDFPIGPVQALAESDSTLARLLADGFEAGRAAVETMGGWLAEGTIGETLYRINTPEAIGGAHDPYLRFLLPIVDGTSAPGADLLAAWYERNIRIFANLHRLGLEPDDRVFLVFGAGHIPILRQLVIDSPYFCVEDPLLYLPAPEIDSVSASLQRSQYDLSADGRAFLLEEAARASFFLLGELHGENEIPALLRSLWPSLWEAGYRHIAAEVSPWAANRLEFGTGEVPVVGLWTQPEATFAASLKADHESVLWGCDIEEAQPHLLIRELAAANRDSRDLQAAVDMVRDGYERPMAPDLLRLVGSADLVEDPLLGGVSLRNSLVRSLEIETDRWTGSRLRASMRREGFMKDLFHEYWVRAGKPRVFLRFGRNHLHRGMDRRGVSTLGNFVAELAAAEHLTAFHVAAFAGGGRIRLAGPPVDFDERSDDPAFAYLASIARYPATVFDLRPVRQVLHGLPENERSAIEASLVYWADSYDVMIFYREVTPLN